MDSKELAQYIEVQDKISQPWMLIQLRLQKLQERSQTISSAEYAQELAEIHRNLMNLGEWWQGREAEVFGG